MSSPKRGDIVVVKIDDPETGEKEHWVKRILAAPGDTIECIQGQIYVNDELLDESEYISPEYEQQMIDEFGAFNTNFDAVTLGEDEYFVMGDNREDSKDSRHLGPIKVENIKGTTKLALFPFSKIGNIE
jgi:signal peptidase I